MKISTVVFLSAASLATRWYRINEPASVCWDETHFGKMAGHYLNRTMFFDVHPPLGKMMIALAGYVSGYDGTFGFDKGGDSYRIDGEMVNYTGMRILCSFLGFLVIPFMAFAVYNTTKSTAAATITYTFLTCDVGLVTLSQYILLDGPLLFFISGSFFFLVMFTNMQNITRTQNNVNRSFSTLWWLMLFACGIFVGGSVSVKWVGIATVCSVGLWTITDLWNIWEKCETPYSDFPKHFMSRSIALILVPISVYILSFYLHFIILNKSGPGDGYYSSVLQSTLVGNPLMKLSCPTYVAHRSIVSIRQNKYAQTGFIHSHDNLVPFNIMPGQLQQVTVYPYDDENNKWWINKDQKNNKRHSLYLQDGDRVQLLHFETKMYLLTRPKSSALTKQHQIVFANSSHGTNSWWKVKLVNEGKSPDRRFKVIHSKFYLINEQYNCNLQSNSKILPEWGNSQIEITCSHHKKDRKNTIWNFHFHSHESLSYEDQNFSHISFWNKLFEVNSMMAIGNSGLKPKPGENYAKPWTWPLLLKGQRFHGVLANETRIYLLGTPFIWWANVIMLFLFPVLSMTLIILKSHCHHYCTEENFNKIQFLKRNCELCFVGKWFYVFWAMHYFPFYFMSRILYFHHYFPAFIFSCCICSITVVIILNIISYFFQSSFGLYTSMLFENDFVNCSLIVLLSFTVSNFVLYSPLCYGMIGPLASNEASTMFGLKLIESWEI